MNSHLPLLPVIIPLTGALVALLLYKWPRLQAGWSLGTITTSFLFSMQMLLGVKSADTLLLFKSGNWPVPFGIALVADPLSALMVVMSQLVFMMGILYALGCKDKVATYPAFYPFFLTLVTGLTGTFLTGDIFNLFVFTELLVISGAILTAISDDKWGTEAAYKYFLISMLAAFFLLLAVGSLYVTYGTLNIADLAARIAENGQTPLLPYIVGFLGATFMIKSAVFPFHFWQPDFHTAAPTPVHAVLSSVVVKLGVYGLLRMTTLLFPVQAPQLQTILIVAGLVGLFYGNLGAVTTYDGKRMLAYSTMGQLGFIMVGIGWGTPLSIAAALVFAFNHSVVKAAMLMMMGTMASRAPVKSAEFENITGVGKKYPLLGILFFVGSMGLIGMPPTNGFVSKLLLFQSGVDAAGWLPLILMGLGGILTIIYTMRAFMRIWWQAAPEPATLVKKQGDSPLAPALLLAIALILGIWPAPLVEFATFTAAWLQEPARYITAVLGG
jgi:multicomponent Na+:H+ antiporter subunit D